MSRSPLSLFITALAAGLAIQAPATAGTVPRSDMTEGHFALGFDPGAFSCDVGMNDRLTFGLDCRDSYQGTAWSGLGTYATLRMLGKSDGWNLAIGGRLSIPNAMAGTFFDARLKDVPSTFGTLGAATGFLLFSVPVAPWFILRYPIGLTYYVGPAQNGGQSWSFGGLGWKPNDDKTLSVSTSDTSYYLPMLQFLPEAAFKFWGLELTLFGNSIAGCRLTF